jgi:hypothetical protein
MAVLHVGAIYATKSLLLQRVYIPDHDVGEIFRQHVGPGESLMLVPINIYRIGGALAVQATIGVPAHSGRCAVVHSQTGEVVDMIIACPDVCQQLNGHSVIQTDIAVQGDMWDGKDFTRMHAHVDAKTGLIITMHRAPIGRALPAPAEHFLLEVAPDAKVGDLFRIPRQLEKGNSEEEWPDLEWPD